MDNAINNIKKSRGRPKTDTVAVMLRIPADVIQALDRFKDEQGCSTRPETIRVLVKDGLTALGYLRQE